MYKYFITLIAFNCILSIQNAMSQGCVTGLPIDYADCYELYRKNFVKPQFKDNDTTALCNLLTNEINPYLLTVPLLKVPERFTEPRLSHLAPLVCIYFWVSERSIKDGSVGCSGTGIIPAEAFFKIVKQCHSLFIKSGTLNGKNVLVEVTLPIILTPDKLHIQLLCPTDEEFRVAPEDSKSDNISCWYKAWWETVIQKKGKAWEMELQKEIQARSKK
ncbi:hypothetical protein FACS18945_3550 [Bacteroidia bacterium]|nr:hypothetical protein FACS18945_3550 [Bacteroidia bacterium]